ncbi:hypothetical protein IV203_014664 [Nitzschia inconspicua]|uniref:Uncharacterized protein n=1 Tax=Nitzschia inconspicua TaxID=303405 RepID=A0A9K3PSJ8_9STRA|nr:hypothetical protein IV203_018996 [Nitzschia inconspicua]KAG7358077.1 hypothetical protein IV203_014664 [Nitzschia inconspicua]
MISFEVICKTHGVAAICYGLLFAFASFGYSIPILGPAALLKGWDSSENESLKFLALFLAGVMFGVGYFEWVMADHQKAKDVFVRYHVVLVILVAYATFGAAVSWLSWLYVSLIVLFMIAGFFTKPVGFRSV